MIYDTLNQLGQYFHKDSPLHRAIAFVQDFDRTQADGRYPIDGDALYALVSTYDTSAPAERRFEAHQKYLDVQALLDGEETIEVSLEPNLPFLQEYNATKDIMHLAPPQEYSTLVMKPGYAAVFYPQDVHRPNCHLHGKCPVRKIVVKVRM